MLYQLSTYLHRILENVWNIEIVYTFETVEIQHFIQILFDSDMECVNVDNVYEQKKMWIFYQIVYFS